MTQALQSRHTLHNGQHECKGCTHVLFSSGQKTELQGFRQQKLHATLHKVGFAVSSQHTLNRTVL